MTTTLDRPSTVAATVAREGTKTRGFFGTLASTDTPLEVVTRWCDEMERRVDALQAKVERQQTALRAARRYLRGELGAASAAEVTALVEAAERFGEAEANAEANSMAAYLNTRDYEDVAGAQE